MNLSYSMVMRSVIWCSGKQIAGGLNQQHLNGKQVGAFPPFLQIIYTQLRVCVCIFKHACI